MNLMPLANLLEQALLGVKGDTLFLDMLPANAETAILLRNPLTGTRINHELPGYFQAEFQLIVRVPARTYDTGLFRIEEMVEALTLERMQVENLFFTYCRPRTDPVSFPLSDGNLLEFSVSFDCCFVRS